MDKRLEQIAQEAASSLRDDPELAREVGEELKDHLADAIEHYEAEGVPPSAAIERALLDFGSPVEVAARLQEANRRRMGLRALIRLGLRWLAVPAAVGIACWLTVSAVDDLVHLPWAQHYAPGFFGLVGGHPADLIDRLDLSREQGLFLTGGASGEASSRNVVYFANYASRLVSGAGDVEKRLQELSKGFELDPQNSRYDYLVASVLLERAVQLQPQFGAFVSPEEISLSVVDRAALERAMGFARSGLQKAEYRKYQLEILEEWLTLLPCDSWTDQLLRLR
ncbi:MAG: hypothetical protein EHM61_18145, partial [Acidobacteria bacterium]